MTAIRRPSPQLTLIPRSTRSIIDVGSGHPLVRLTDELDWDELTALIQEIRRSKLKSNAGRPPHLRALAGAVVLMATRRLTLRDAEDQIRYYAPARYLCGLTETHWSPDFTTIHDFMQLMGEDGMRRLNEYAVSLAVERGFADPSVLVADTTAQEAAIPYPNEVGLIGSFVASVTSACSRAGKALKSFLKTSGAKLDALRKKIREYRLFSAKKPKEVKDKMVAKMVAATEQLQGDLAGALADSARTRVRGAGKAAARKVKQLHVTMTKLLPQIRYWLRTGRVATDKIINLHMPELYSIVRGKAGKKVEFGLNWGFARLRGGFVLATVAATRRELTDAVFAVRAVEDHIALFGKPPRAYAYDRAGYSNANVQTLQALGVEQVALAPIGRCAWAVDERTRKELVKERARVEGSIGAVKSTRYGFHRPGARSVEMMGACGHRSVLGFNLNKLVRELSREAEAAV